jgi:hypothetical protein
MQEDKRPEVKAKLSYDKEHVQEPKTSGLRLEDHIEEETAQDGTTKNNIETELGHETSQRDVLNKRPSIKSSLTVQHRPSVLSNILGS